MLDEDTFPDEAVRWLFGAGPMSGGGFTSTIAGQVRDVLGPGSDGWSMIRQAASRQLASKPEGMVQPGPQQVSESIASFLNGASTRDLSSTLFTDAEMSRRSRSRRQSSGWSDLPSSGTAAYM